MNASTSRQADRVFAQHDPAREAPETSGSPRRPLIAALLSAVLPGFGQLYNGRVNRGIWLYLSFVALTVPFTAFIALYLPTPVTVAVLALGLLLTLGVWAFGIIDAWRLARRTSQYRTARWQTSGMYALVFLVCNLLALPWLTNLVRTHQVQAFRTPSNSMLPTVRSGDYLFADKRYNCPSCAGSVARGDVAVFVYPDNRTNYYIKRVIGLPGDTIEISAQGLALNGQALSDSIVMSPGISSTETYDGRTWQVHWGNELRDALTVTVAPGHAFVLGDNRGASTDSRKFGLVPLSDVVGKARQIWFSKGPDGIRWSRIGQALNPQPASDP